MKIHSVHLKNFRGIGDLELDFTDRINVLVGVNGVGKSAVLDALAILLSQVSWRIYGNYAKARPFSPDDIEVGKAFTRVDVLGELSGLPVNWRLARNRKAGAHPPERSSDLQPVNTVVSYHFGRQPADAPRSDDFPLMVYYDVHRAVIKAPMRVREKARDHPLEAYVDALEHNGADFKRFFIWFRNQEDVENEQRRDNPNDRDKGLDTVRRAIEDFLGIRDPRIRRKPLRMTVDKAGIALNVNQLSDGEKCMLALVGDIARRLAMLNPGLEDPRFGKGVVLIDELELHLHPGWQCEMIKKLSEAFPRCQFIVSTHSSLVLSHVHPHGIWLMQCGSQGVFASRPRTSFGMDSSRILEELMDVPARESGTQFRLGELFAALERNHLSNAKDLLEGLSRTAPDIPELVRARALLKRKELLGK